VPVIVNGVKKGLAKYDSIFFTKTSRRHTVLARLVES